MATISRVIFNFTSKCNLPCRFCYIPFDRIDTREVDLWKRIVDRCKSLGAQVITFGGGDPFMYRDFMPLLKHSFDGKTFLQIDTNALALHERHVPSLAAHANLVGLPLEGSAEVHNDLRGHDRHHGVVVKWLHRLVAARIPIKINTVVTQKNVASVPELAAFLDGVPIARWSIYQFWALSAGRDNRKDFEVSHADYVALVSELKDRYPRLNIEASTSQLRHKSYFFVSHTGRVYVMNRDDQEEYVHIGSIFDDDIVAKWEEHGDHGALLRRTLLRKIGSAKGASAS